MKIAAIQFASTPNEPELNRQKAISLINEAADQGACLLVMPEFWLAGFEPQQILDQGETLRGDTVSLLRRLARKRQVFLVGGSLAEKRDGRLYNTVVTINETGEIAAKYRKAHLNPQEEQIIFSPGDEWIITECNDLRLGIISGYDIYYPEFTRNLALRGAQVLIIPLLIKENIEEVRLLARARALENGCFVVMANQARDTASGGSLIISPDGRILAEAGTQDMVLISELEMNSLEHALRARNYINYRRNILDEIDNSQL